MSEKNKNELVITRIFNAPRGLVWKAWTDPKQISQWWGPHGFTAPLCEWDAQPGNTILVHMHGPKGSPFDFDMPMGGIFEEVHAPERLVFISNAMPDETGMPQLEVRNTVTFEECAGKTRLTLHAVVTNPHLPWLERLRAWSKAGRKVWRSSPRCLRNWREC